MKAAKLIWQEEQRPTSCQLKTQHSSWQEAQAAYEDMLQSIGWNCNLVCFSLCTIEGMALTTQDLLHRDSASSSLDAAAH